jgi:co-chaperonin GroES (HSP10)
MTSLPFRPLEDRIVLKPDPIPEIVNGIVRPESVLARQARQGGQYGRVLRLGPGMLRADGRRWPMPDVVPGDRVVFDAEGAQKIEVDGEILLSVREDFVHAVCELGPGENRCRHSNPACDDCVAHDTLCANSS